MYIRKLWKSWWTFPRRISGFFMSPLRHFCGCKYVNILYRASQKLEAQLSCDFIMPCFQCQEFKNPALKPNIVFINRIYIFFDNWPALNHSCEIISFIVGFLLVRNSTIIRHVWNIVYKFNLWAVLLKIKLKTFLDKVEFLNE